MLYFLLALGQKLLSKLTFSLNFCLQNYEFFSYSMFFSTNNSHIKTNLSYWVINPEVQNPDPFGFHSEGIEFRHQDFLVGHTDRNQMPTDHDRIVLDAFNPAQIHDVRAVNPHEPFGREF